MLAAQLTHAAGESFQVPVCDREVYAVVLQVADEPELARIEDELVRAGVEHVAFREPDLGGALTAIGCRPLLDKKALPKRVRSLALLGATS